MMINIIYNMSLFRMAWIVAHKGSITSVAEFEKNVVLEVVGDDNIYNLSEYACVYFNQHIITDTFATMGIVYTAENKDKGFEAPPTRPLEELTFLKR